MHMRLSKLLIGAVVISAALFGQMAPQQPPPPGYPQGGYPQGYPQGAPQGYPQGGVMQGNPQAEPVDEPGRQVARLSVLSGEVTVRRGDSGDWVAAVLNAPLLAGDSVSVAAGGAAEMQLDNANFARLAGDSEARLSILENGRYQIQLSKGLLTYRVLRQSAAQSEIATPLAAVRPVGLSAVRVEVAPDGSMRAIVRHGDAEVATPKGSEKVHEGNMMTLRGAAEDPEFQTVYAPVADQWDTWSDQRDGYLSRAQSPQHVSQDVYGSEDLDAYGRWSNDPAYGDVWTPNVPPTWAPYRNGEWVWEDSYGWTWVDSDPWGWAPFHYGSWYFRTGLGWSWFPGPRYGHYWWHPALVGFFGFGGGFGVGFGFGNVGWIPLAPFERFHPWYGRGFVGGGRLGGVGIVAGGNITSLYRNARFANGATAVSAADFQRGNFRGLTGVSSAQLQQASALRGGVLSPTAANMRFSSRSTASFTGPRADVSSQRFFSRMPAGAGAGAAARTAAAPGWQRFSGSAAGGGQSARPLQVAPQILHQREAGPAANGYQGNRGGYAAPAARPAPSAPAPSYRSAPAPAPSYRSAPAPAPRSSGGGGGHASGSGRR